ncbi:MAG: hypothetical protein AB8G16_15005 [Gammaproteobacteria bacterium]
MSDARPNLYRIDDTLIRGGYIAMVVAFVFAGRLITESYFGFSRWLMFFVVALAPVAMLWIGYAIRRRENRILDVGRVLARHHTVPIRDLCEMSGFSPERLREAVAVLNRKLAAGLSWQEEHGLVTRFEMQSLGSLSHAQRCESCGASVTVDVDASTSAADLRCTYCHGALDGQHISTLQMQLRQPKIQTFAAVPAAPAKAAPKRFSMLVFVLLAVFFWPGAVIYAVVRARSAPMNGNNPFN